MYVVDGGKEEAGRTAGSMEMILPVEGDTDIVAGERTRLSSGSVSTALVDTRTVKGPDVGMEVDTAILIRVLAGKMVARAVQTGKERECVCVRR